MPNFDSVEEARKFLRVAFQVDARRRSEQFRRSSVAMCYYHGDQWLHATRQGFQEFDELRSLARQVAPESNDLRIVTNRTNRFIEKIASSTFPKRIDLDARPPDRSSGADVEHASEVMRAAASLFIEKSGAIRSFQAANHNRSLAGRWCVGLHLRRQTRDLGDGPETDFVLKTFNFNPSRLTIDPFNKSPDLRDHEWLIYSEVMTASKIRRDYGVDISKQVEEKMQTVGQLAKMECEFNRISGGKLYDEYAMYSKTKGGRVHTMFAKDDRGVFSKMYIFVDLNDGEIRWVNEDDPTSPYGFDGLPFIQLRAHHGGDAHFDLSDFDFLRDDQDRLNLIQTHLHRIIQNACHYKWVVNRAWHGNRSTNEDFKSQYHNRVGGLIIGDSRMKGIPPPQIVQPPSPPNWALDMTQMLEGSMREQSSLSEGQFGETKSHVPDASFQAALREADRVLGVRVVGDIRQYEIFAMLVLGTVIRHIDKPSIAQCLVQAKFLPEDLGILASEDSERPLVNLKVREGSVRHRSHDSVRSDLDLALQSQAISPEGYRTEMVRIDEPLTMADAEAVRWAARKAASVANGEPYEPIPLGPIQTEALVQAFTRELYQRDERGERDAVLRLAEAIQLAAPPPPTDGEGEGEAQPLAPENIPIEEALAGAIGGQF